MKYISFLYLVFLSACMSYDKDLYEHLKAEQEFHEIEYIDDCDFYELDECK